MKNIRGSFQLLINYIYKDSFLHKSQKIPLEWKQFYNVQNYKIYLLDSYLCK